MPSVSIHEWNEFTTRFPNAHLLQSSAWGEFKSDFGWEVERVVAGNSGAQILFKKIPPWFSMAYIAKGPLGNPTPEFWSEVNRLCCQRRAVFLQVEPDAWETDHWTPRSGHWRLSPHNIQPRRTKVLDITGSDEEILSRMKQKTRYNIRLAEKKDVTVRTWQDLDGFHQMMQVTGDRDMFGVHTREYYLQAYARFYPQQCELLVAEYEGRQLAALMVFAFGNRAWYFYGASTNEERNRMPTYLLQWEAIRWARAHGCSEYDLWGVPDEDHEVLEKTFSRRSDGLWGVYRFKRGFGGEVRRAARAVDQVYIPLLYFLYRIWTGLKKIRGAA